MPLIDWPSAELNWRIFFKTWKSSVFYWRTLSSWIYWWSIIYLFVCRDIFVYLSCSKFQSICLSEKNNFFEFFMHQWDGSSFIEHVPFQFCSLLIELCSESMRQNHRIHSDWRIKLNCTANNDCSGIDLWSFVNYWENVWIFVVIHQQKCTMLSLMLLDIVNLFHGVFDRT